MLVLAGALYELLTTLAITSKGCALETEADVVPLPSDFSMQGCILFVVVSLLLGHAFLFKNPKCIWWISKLNSRIMRQWHNDFWVGTPIGCGIFILRCPLSYF